MFFYMIFSYNVLGIEQNLVPKSIRACSGGFYREMIKFSDESSNNKDTGE